MSRFRKVRQNETNFWLDFAAIAVVAERMAFETGQRHKTAEQFKAPSPTENSNDSTYSTTNPSAELRVNSEHKENHLGGERREVQKKKHGRTSRVQASRNAKTGASL